MEFLKQYELSIPEEPVVDPTTAAHNWCYVNGLSTCLDCGLVNTEDQEFTRERTLIRYPKFYAYKRSTYFNQKLNLITGRKCYQRDPQYWTNFIDKLKLEKDNIKTIFDIKRYMKQNHYNRLYKYIYNAWFEIKGYRIIDLDYDQRESLNVQFLEFERWFKSQYIKRNLLNYNIILHELLKRNNIENYNQVCMPINKKITQDIIAKYFH